MDRRILGHVTEDGRVIGFLMERIQNARHAGPQDLEFCRKHCDSKVVLIDFDKARQCDNESALIEEIEDLPGHLQDSSMRGGGGLL